MEAIAEPVRTHPNQSNSRLGANEGDHDVFLRCYPGLGRGWRASSARAQGVRGWYFLQPNHILCSF